MYIAIDGDDVGSHIEFLIIMNQTDKLSWFSDNYSKTINWLIENLAQYFDANIIFSGGDNLLASVDSSQFSFDKLEFLRQEFHKKINKTISIGLGSSPREAYFALKLAKTSGKNSIQNYEDLS